jgi:hypothetical protein
MSEYMGGQLDEQGRRKPFRNIGNAIVDLEWRAKNIDATLDLGFTLNS